MTHIRATSQAFPRAIWRRLTAAFVVVAVAVLLFVRLADKVGGGGTLAYDEAVLRFVNKFASPELDMVSVGLTQLGGYTGAAVLAAGAGALLWLRNRRSMALFVAVGVGGAIVLNGLLKAVFQRDRPELWERLVTENSYSFPSGHAMASGALALSLIVVLWPTRWRWAGLLVGSVYMLGIGLTRMYLGVHYPTDIVAGWMASAAWVAAVACVVLYQKRHYGHGG